MALEVIWFRFLLLFVVSSTLALSLMLAVVLAAIAVGAHGAGWWLKSDRDAGAHVAAVALLASCGLAASYSGFQYIERRRLDGRLVPDSVVHRRAHRADPVLSGCCSPCSESG